MTRQIDCYLDLLVTDRSTAIHLDDSSTAEREDRTLYHVRFFAHSRSFARVALSETLPHQLCRVLLRVNVLTAVARLLARYAVQLSVESRLASSDYRFVTPVSAQRSLLTRAH